jgi:hypothetical protein
MIKNIDTCDLVSELATREAVQEIVFEPYEELSLEKVKIKSGPARILIIWD